MVRSVLMTSWLAACCLALTPAAFGVQGDPLRREFPLEEVSGFDTVDFGHVCGCQSDPEPNVVYPAFSSGKPLYGVMPLDAEFNNLRSGTPYHFAIDESGGTGAGYDRLYIDLNRDGRLLDETPIASLRELPKGRLFGLKWVAPPVWFGCVTFSSPEEAGTHSVETIPRLLIDGGGYVDLSFTAVKARKGEIEIAGRRYSATILNNNPLGTRWDRPGTTVKLEALAGARMPYWALSNRLMSMPRVEDRYWRLSTTPAGDRLFVEPYEGPTGVLRINLGGWPFRKAAFSGTLLAKDKLVPAGRDDGKGQYQPVESCEVPVGDYTPALLGIRCGSTTVQLADNPYGDGLARSSDPNGVYRMRIREDKPCVLDLSRKPDVLFVTPGLETRLRPGDLLQMTTALINPQSNVMIGNLRGVSRERVSPTALVLIGLTIVGPLGAWIGVGRGRRRYRYLPLFSVIGLLALGGYLGTLFAVNAMLHPDPSAREELRPRVTITRANGEILDEGSMPFG